jgi:hypothetical protein
LSRSRSYCKISVQWVKGHLKGKKKTIEHWLNKEVHNLADSFLQGTYGYESRKQVIDAPSYEVSILRGRSTLTSKLSTYISEQLYSEPLQNTICKNEGWAPDTLNNPSELLIRYKSWNLYVLSFLQSFCPPSCGY